MWSIDFVLALFASMHAVAQESCAYISSDDSVRLLSHGRCPALAGPNSFLAEASYSHSAESLSTLDCHYLVSAAGNVSCSYDPEDGRLVASVGSTCFGTASAPTRCGSFCFTSCPNANLYGAQWSASTINGSSGVNSLSCDYEDAKTCEYSVKDGERINQVITDDGCPPVSAAARNLCLYQ